MKHVLLAHVGTQESFSHYLASIHANGRMTLGEVARTQGLGRRVVLCPTRTPEPHERGEFPMTCYQCHMYADA